MMPRGAALVVEAASGCGAARDALARRYLRPAYRVALSVVGRPADAEDVAQEALLKALSRLETCRSPDRFEAWLTQIVRNQARNWVDARRLRDVPRFPPTDEPADARSAIDRPATRWQLTVALERLTEPQRTVLLLHALGGYSHPEIAASLGVSVVSSRQHLFLARQTLRAFLRGAEDAGPATRIRTSERRARR